MLVLPSSFPLRLHPISPLMTWDGREEKEPKDGPNDVGDFLTTGLSSYYNVFSSLKTSQEHIIDYCLTFSHMIQQLNGSSLLPKSEAFLHEREGEKGPDTELQPFNLPFSPLSFILLLSQFNCSTTKSIVTSAATNDGTGL